MAKRKAAVVSLESVSKSVESAIKLAVARHDVGLDEMTFLDRWEIIGRRLRDFTDINQAFEFAADVTRRVKVRGLVASPVVTKIDKDILVGFIDRSRLPRQL